MHSRRALFTVGVGAAVLAISAGSAFAGNAGGGPGAVVYHCDAVPGGAVHGSASYKVVDGIPDPSSVHGSPSCAAYVDSMIGGGF
jgi:hypothetical protein